MDFKEILDTCKAQALVHTLVPSELSVWRACCRSYSEAFHTPLHVVLELDPEDVLLAVFEKQLDNFDEEKDLEHILETIYSLEDPNYEQFKERELQSFIKRAEREEKERLKKGKPIHKALKEEDEVSLKSTPKKVEKPEPVQAVGGKLEVNKFEHLEGEESPGDFD